jgi:UDP-2,4-diacetamido-2,4,6-trideoxy-beta-L-altropyranose hydrolase
MESELRGRVFFRADGGSKMGLGHVIRSIALMQMLRDDFDCSFLIRDPSESLIKQIKDAGGRPVALPSTVDHLAEAVRITEAWFSPGDIVVVDGYHFDAHYQNVIKVKGCKLVAIDDIHENCFLADVVINHGGGLAEEAYRCSPETRLCLGPEFALLRPEFLKNIESKEIIRDKEGVFVCMGGADPLNLSLYIAERLLSFEHIKTVNLVIGGANLFYGELRELAEKESRVNLWRDVDAGKIVSLMRGSEFAVVPASSVSYEVASTGTPMFVGHYVDNQVDLYEFLLGNGLAFGLGNFYDDKLWEKLTGFDGAVDLVSAQKRFFDGDSDKRLRNLFLNLQYGGYMEGKRQKTSKLGEAC